MKNNFFEFCKNELSQDAFFCWCLNWINCAEDENSLLFQMAISFLELISDKADYQLLEELKAEKRKGVQDELVKIETQYESIDILLTICQKKQIIIEDKIYSSVHDDQLNRYYKSLMGNAEQEKINQNPISVVYIKTGNYYPEDDAVTDVRYKNEAGMEFSVKIIKIGRAELKQVFRKYADMKNPEGFLVSDFYKRLLEMDGWYERYEKYYREHDYENAFQENYGQLFCMKDLFGDKIGQQMPGKMYADKKYKTVLEAREYHGNPFTWFWLWGPHGEGQYGCWIGYRLDHKDKMSCISLKLYRYFIKQPDQELIRSRMHDLYEIILEGLKKHICEDYPNIKSYEYGSWKDANETCLIKFDINEKAIDDLKNSLWKIGAKAVEIAEKSGFADQR